MRNEAEQAKFREFRKLGFVLILIMSGRVESQFVFEAKKVKDGKGKQKGTPDSPKGGLSRMFHSVFDKKSEDLPGGVMTAELVKTNSPTVVRPLNAPNNFMQAPAPLVVPPKLEEKKSPPALPPKKKDEVEPKVINHVESAPIVIDSIAEIRSVAASKELFTQLTEYETTRTSYLKIVKPLLDEKNNQLDILFQDYLIRLSHIIDSQGLNSKVKDAMLLEEQEKLKKVKQQLFGDTNTSSKVFDREIQERKNVLALEKRIVLIQSVWRGYKIRKQFQKSMKNTRHRNKVIAEILETEKVYVTNMNNLVNYYFKPMKASQVVSGKELLIIFSNIELILNVNNELKDSLEKRYTNWSKTQTIGDVFLKLAPFLKLYIQYVNNYNLSLSTIDHLKKTSEVFKDLVEKPHRDNPSVPSLESLQIMPVQRIPRYEMLLKDLVKFTDEDHPDFKSLCDALFKIKDVATRINESKRMAENLNATIRIQQTLGLEDLVQPHRRFVMEGDLYYADQNAPTKDKKSSTSMTRVFADMGIQSKASTLGGHTAHLYLFNDIMILAHAKGFVINSSSANWKHHQTVKLEDLTIEPSQERSFIVILDKGKSQIEFFASKEEEKNKWIDEISKAVHDLSVHKQSLRLEPTVEQQKDKLLSMFPSVSELNSSMLTPSFLTPSLSSSSLSNISNARSVESLNKIPVKLNDLIPIYEKVFELQKELFSLPIELDSLIPQYTQSLPPARMIQIYDRIQALKKMTDDMLQYNDAIITTFRNERLVVELSTLLRDGQDRVDNMRKWIQSQFQNNDPNSKQPKVLTAYLMEWYINLVDKWEAIVDDNM